MRIVKLVSLSILMVLVACKAKSQKVHTPKSPIYNLTINDIDGNALDLSKFKGKKILFVNVASKCGFTKQYKGLEELSKTYKEQLVVIGLPCNQFGGQEPGNAEQIKSFCSATYGVDFPITEKIKVKGDQQHPIYKWLTDKNINGVKSSSVKWNFQKYLVDENGNYIDFWHSMTKPTSSKITKYLD